mgnify:CR=1 FL=1
MKGTRVSWMMRREIDNLDFPPVDEFLEILDAAGCHLYACKMSVDMMELDEEKLIEGVVVWTAEDFLKYSVDCKICLFT